jgi:ferredoxin--NADP+ reductase
VTREPFHTSKRIEGLMLDGTLFKGTLGDPKSFDHTQDRVMLCGSMAMIKEVAAMLDGMGFTEGSNSQPGEYVIERAFVG